MGVGHRPHSEPDLAPPTNSTVIEMYTVEAAAPIALIIDLSPANMGRRMAYSAAPGFCPIKDSGTSAALPTTTRQNGALSHS